MGCGMREFQGVLVTLGLKSLQVPVSLSANTRTKDNAGLFCCPYTGMEWELQVVGQKIFGASVSTNAASDMGSVRQE